MSQYCGDNGSFARNFAQACRDLAEKPAVERYGVVVTFDDDRPPKPCCPIGYAYVYAGGKGIKSTNEVWGLLLKSLGLSTSPHHSRTKRVTVAFAAVWNKNDAYHGHPDGSRAQLLTLAEVIDGALSKNSSISQ